MRGRRLITAFLHFLKPPTNDRKDDEMQTAKKKPKKFASPFKAIRRIANV